MAQFCGLTRAGQILVGGKEVSATFEGQVNRLRTPYGVAYDFSGIRSGIELVDAPELHLTGALTIAAWIYPRSYHVRGDGSQILFRGDNRRGLDPYFLRLEEDGRVHFEIDSQNATAQVSAPIELNQWHRITASFDPRDGALLLWFDGAIQARGITKIRPLTDLDPSFEPAVGIGNLNRSQPFNQPFDGIVADLRLYRSALGPRQTGFSLTQLNRIRGAKPTL